ncbi:MAG: T9SS type A sorting domain-containing protein [Crocinitomicaceae bacterium]|nr:T9SS type A sorting domain-containing protein [Crocinitomicaceae bacterium]
MKKRLLLAIALSTLGFGTFAQDVNIPDANLKAYLVGNSAINTNGDAEIQVSEATAFTGDIFANNLGITDLTGIEAFINVDGLYVRGNSLGTIDVSANVAMTYLDCRNTGISTLDLSSNIALEGIDCMLNNLTSLDLSNNPNIGAIHCSDNDLTSLDVSNNLLLSNFSCDNNDLTSIDVSNNTALVYFVCHFNDLSSIDVSNCTDLSWFSCAGNNLTSLDVSNNLALGNLYCGVNNISLLDLGANTALQVLNCTVNDLSILNVANGNNVNFSLFAASDNPNLTCIQVDDATWSTTNWTSIDPASSFSLDCNYPLAVNEVDLVQDLSIYPNPSSSILTIVLENEVNSISIIGSMGNEIQASLSSSNTIDVSELANGVYILQVETERGIIREKFIKD